MPDRQESAEETDSQGNLEGTELEDAVRLDRKDNPAAQDPPVAQDKMDKLAPQGSKANLVLLETKANRDSPAHRDTQADRDPLACQDRTPLIVRARREAPCSSTASNNCQSDGLKNYTTKCDIATANF